MKKQLVIIGITLVLIAVGLSGCSQQNSSSNQSKNQTTNQPSTESIQTILAKAETIGSMYYEVATSTNMPGVGTYTVTTKIWQKTPYLKEDIKSVTAGITTTLLVIQRPEGIYKYDITQNKYVLTTSIVTLEQSNSEMTKDLLNNQTITTLGTETIDGKTATILQYMPKQEGNSTAMKMWVWNEKGVPLKALVTTTSGGTTITMDINYSNYSFSDIPDSTFSVL
jgi:outer membrane lipoprotein-sorting protein